MLGLGLGLNKLGSYLGNRKPPFFTDLVQWLTSIYYDSETDTYKWKDSSGKRDGETLLAVYATGLSQLQLTNLTGRTIIDVQGTTTAIIDGNNVTLDPTKEFSSIQFDDKSFYSLEYKSLDLIHGEQECRMVGTPVFGESIKYKCYRNELGYNVEDSVGDFGSDFGNDFGIQ